MVRGGRANRTDLLVENIFEYVHTYSYIYREPMQTAHISISRFQRICR